ncbi:MAG: serine hydrolase [Gemmatimonadetes bacterium]|nr:serine hydrolase [Gemmatimonadota bacterium]
MFRSFLFLAALVVATDAAAQSTALKPGNPLHASLNTGDTVRYALATESDYFVRGVVDQITVDVVVRILRPDGRVVRTIDGPARGSERFQFETDMEGAYQIEVIPFEEETGDYVITLDLLEPVATDPEKLADQLLSAYDGEDSPGAVVSVFKDGETLFARAYGMANLSYGIPFEVDTRTNIGSTSKQFTAFAVMLLVERGELSLDDDVRKHIPELPDFGDTVTVRNLLTHTSGYREFLNLLIMTGRRLDHGDFIDRQELISIVQRQPALQNTPGEEFNYNNTAFGLAAVIVERISGQTFPEFMAENVFGPIGMTRTMVRPSPEHIVEGKAEGYTPGDDGTYREIGDLGGALGAGGIYSTVGDLQKWVENFSSAKVGSKKIFEQMMTPYVLNNGDSTGYGFGLTIDEQRGLRRVHHGGADVAHRSQLAYYPEIGAGITTQSNHASFDRSIAFRLAEAFFGDHMEAEGGAEDTEESAFDPSTYDAEAFDEFVGRYALDARPDFILTFSREGEALYTQATGQRQLEIVPTSDSTFSLLGVEASVTFHRNPDGEVEALTLHQGGDNRATRLADDEEEDWAPTLEDLGAYVGRYFSREIETFYVVTLEEDRLVLQHRRMDDRNLKPGAVDAFAGGGLQVSFERDRNGRVIGFYMSNGRTREVRFERLN